jgi:membrane-bound lytic murein transglycosylase A
MKKWIQSLLFIVIFSVGGCMRAPGQLPVTPSETFVRVHAADIDFSDDLNFKSLERAVERSIRYYEGAGKNYVYHLPDRRVDADS